MTAKPRRSAYRTAYRTDDATRIKLYLASSDAEGKTSTHHRIMRYCPIKKRNLQLEWVPAGRGRRTAPSAGSRPR